jgi:hypothetical protein
MSRKGKGKPNPPPFDQVVKQLKGASSSGGQRPETQRAPRKPTRQSFHAGKDGGGSFRGTRRRSGN